MGCGAGKPQEGGDAKAAPPPATMPATKMTDDQLVEGVAAATLPRASMAMGRSAAARKRRLLKEELMKRHDASGQGTLSREEVSQLMVKYEGTEFTPTDEEVDLVMRCGGDSCKPVLTTNELVVAMAIVKAMADQQKALNDKFEEYDVNKSGALEIDQLAKLLKDLNNGEEVPQEEVDAVLKQADASETNSILREELKPAVMIWYTMKEETEEPKE